MAKSILDTFFEDDTIGNIAPPPPPSEKLYLRKLKFALPPNNNNPNIYVLRLLPYLAEGTDGLGKTIYTNATYTVQDLESGTTQYVTSAISAIGSRPDYTQACPLANYWSDCMSNLSKSDRDLEYKRVSKFLGLRQTRYINAYVVSAPKDQSDIVGTVVVLPATKSIWNLISRALDTSEEAVTSQMALYGETIGKAKLFSLGANGFDLVIPVESKVVNGTPLQNYDKASLRRASVAVPLTAEQIAERNVDPTKIDYRLKQEAIETIASNLPPLPAGRNKRFGVASTSKTVTDTPHQPDPPAKAAPVSTKSAIADELDDVQWDDDIPF